VRLWGYDPGSSTDLISKPTENFDDCGLIINGSSVAKPSRKKEFANVLDFMEWYQVPLMHGFGIIIIDDKADKSTYQGVFERGYNIDCFANATRLKAMKGLIISFISLIFSY